MEGGGASAGGASGALPHDLAAALLEATADDSLKHAAAISQVVDHAKTTCAPAPLVGALRQRLLVRDAGGVAGFRAKIKAMDVILKIFQLEEGEGSAFRHAAREALPAAIDALTRYESGDGEPAECASQVQQIAGRLLQMVRDGMTSMPSSGEIVVAARSKKESVIKLMPSQRLRWGFTVSKFDIFFSVTVHDTRGGWEDRRVVVAPVKLQASDGTVVGDYLADGAAEQVVTFCWDNKASKLREKRVAFELEIVTPSGTPRAAADAGDHTRPEHQFGAVSAAGTTTTEDLVERARASAGGADSESAMGRLARIRSRSNSGSDSDSGGLGTIARTSGSIVARVSAVVGGKSEVEWDRAPDPAEHDRLVRHWRAEVLPHWARERTAKSTMRLIAAGVPPEVRPMLWRAAVPNVLDLSRQEYERVLEEVSACKKTNAQRGHMVGETPRSQKLRQLIATDLTRTVAGVGGAFAVNGSAEQNELRQVLEAYAALRPDFGYVQGMSFVAATLLVHTAAVAQLRGFTRESLSQMPLSQLTKVAAAEGIEPAHLEAALRSDNRLESLKSLLFELLPPSDEPPQQPEHEEQGSHTAPTSSRSTDSEGSWELVSPANASHGATTVDMDAAAGASLVVPLDDLAGTFETVAPPETEVNCGSTVDVTPLSLQLEPDATIIEEDSIYSGSPDHFLGRVVPEMTTHSATGPQQQKQRRQSICSWSTGPQGGPADTVATPVARDSYHAFVLLANIIAEKSDRILLALMRLEADKMELLFEYFSALLREHAPKLECHFDELGIMPQMYLIEWLFTLFVKSLPSKIVAWIWDHILVFGDSYIFSASIGLLVLLEPHLLLQQDMTSGSQLLKNIVECRMQFEPGPQYPREAFEEPALWQEYFDTVNELASRTDPKKWEEFKRQLLA